VREAAAAAAINPNTVMKAYRELELEGLLVSRPGQGVFVHRSLAGPSLKSHEALRRSFRHWLKQAGDAGLDGESINALIQDTIRETREGNIA
jgi:GntR family transcriptional regulator